MATSVQTTVVLRDAGGNLLFGRPVTYWTDNALVATVNASGKVTAVGAGSTTIHAECEGIQDAITVTVT